MLGKRVNRKNLFLVLIAFSIFDRTPRWPRGTSRSLSNSSRGTTLFSGRLWSSTGAAR